MTLFILASCSCLPMSIQPDYNKQICPLSKYNIKAAEDLMEGVQKLLEEAHEQGLDTSKVEQVLTEAVILLEYAKTISNQGQNCIAGNILAIKCQKLLKRAQEMLELMLDALRVDEYAVYSALIKAKYTKGLHFTGNEYVFGQVQIIVIMDHTSLNESAEDGIGKTLEWVHENMPAIAQETLDNFHTRNVQEHPLDDFFDLEIKLVFMSEEEVEEHFQKDGWLEFYEIYPFSQGIMTLSKVGFNSEMNQALVYVGNQSSWDSGAGYYVLLFKENNVWIIQDEVVIWIS